MANTGRVNWHAHTFLPWFTTMWSSLFVFCPGKERGRGRAQPEALQALEARQLARPGVCFYSLAAYNLGLNLATAYVVCAWYRKVGGKEAVDVIFWHSFMPVSSPQQFSPAKHSATVRLPPPFPSRQLSLLHTAWFLYSTAGSIYFFPVESWLHAVVLKLSAQQQLVWKLRSIIMYYMLDKVMKRLYSVFCLFGWWL